MENEDYSDSSDEDYVPNGGEIVSEEEDSGEEEGFIPGEEDERGSEDKKQQTSDSNCRSKLPTKRNRGCRQSKANNKAFNCDSKSNTSEKASKDDDATEEAKDLKEKKKDEDLWADFIKDVGGASKGKSTVTTSASSSSSSPSPSPRTTNTSNKVAITKEYNFAGETVVVTKEVDVNSKDAKIASSSDADRKNISACTKSSLLSSSVASVAPALKRPSGGLSAILGKLDKKPKLSTLDKSKLDWDSFKEKEGIEEELKTHNRGKEGYLERVAFLERADQRQFEIERSLRLGTSRKQ